MNPLLIKTKTQESAISPYRLLKFGSADSSLVQAVDSSAAIVAVSNMMASAVAAQPVDGQLAGILEVQLGGQVTRGQFVTSDANGCGVAANLVTGTTVYHAGIALQSGVSGDVVTMLFVPGVLHNDSLIAVIDKTITTGQLLALNATPIEVIPAPGANKSIVVLGALAYMPYNSIAYDGIAGGEDLVLAYTNGSGTALAKFETTGFLDQASSQRRYATPSQYGDTNLNPTVNAALVAALLTGEIATGNSPLKLRVWYRIIDTVLP